MKTKDVLNELIVSLRHCEAKDVSAYDLYIYAKGLWKDDKQQTLIYIYHAMAIFAENKIFCPSSIKHRGALEQVLKGKSKGFNHLGSPCNPHGMMNVLDCVR
jgi:hypothetical protein